MKRLIFFLLAISSYSLVCHSQTIITPFTTSIKTNDGIYFYKGDTVTIFGYNKKKKRHYFYIRNDSLIKSFNIDTIPFELKEKELKKLPKPTRDDFNSIIQSQSEIVKQTYRPNALQALYKCIWNGKEKNDKNILKYLSEGDTVFIFAYDNDNNYYHKYNYAIGTKYIFGTFSSYDSPSSLFTGININTNYFDYLPSTEDPYILNLGENLNGVVKQMVKDKAINGDIKSQIKINENSSIISIEENPITHTLDRFSNGDSIIIFGKSDSRYAISSVDKIGIVRVDKSVFQLDEDLLDCLPDINDEDVQKAYMNKSVLVKEEQDRLKFFEEQRRDSIRLAHIKRQDELYENGYYIDFSNTYFESNSAGNITPHFTIINNSSKTIKYVYLCVYFKNRVNDIVYNEINRDLYLDIQLTGPINGYNKESYSLAYSKFYAPTAYSMYIKEVLITYMDGSQKTMEPISVFRLDNSVFNRLPF